MADAEGERCEKCNAPLNPGAKQCENCGHKTCDD